MTAKKIFQKRSPEVFVKLFRKAICSCYLTNHWQKTCCPRSEGRIEFLLPPLTFAEAHQRQFIFTSAFSAVNRRITSRIVSLIPTSLNSRGISGCIDSSLWHPKHFRSQELIYFLLVAHSPPIQTLTLTVTYKYFQLKWLLNFLIERCSLTILVLFNSFLELCYLILLILFVGTAVTVTTERIISYAFCIPLQLWKVCTSFVRVCVCVWMHMHIYFWLESRQYKEWNSSARSLQLPVMSRKYKIKLKTRMLEDSIRNNLTFIEQQMVIKSIKPWLSC